ncbi:1320_t:CDS:1 [Acaulospora morrowiae]|uniref:1320_t:CDS:1 n=1 Tax=Acaulospora morrowiae TaxID=94023 RepID=A0A9N9FAT9_9GLOM|nr:1320_t:CDS:1 [Acaulospora morrowiae]
MTSASVTPSRNSLDDEFDEETRSLSPPRSPQSSSISPSSSTQSLTKGNNIGHDYYPPLSPEDIKDDFWDSIYNRSPSESSITFEYQHHRSSIPSVASSTSSCFSYRQDNAPLRWRNKHASNSKNQVIGQSTNTSIAGQNYIKYSYREAMDVICGGEVQNSYPRQECKSPDVIPLTPDVTPYTSVTTLSNISESLDPSILNSDGIFKLSELHMISLLQRDDLEIPEVEIWNKVIAWGVKNAFTDQFDADVSKWSPKDFEALAKTLRNCIYWIRFHQIEPFDFAKYVLPYRPIIPPFIIGNFLRQQITGHIQLTPLLAPPRIASTLVDSSIITGRHATILESWIKENELSDKNFSCKFNLLYRGSRDGVSSKKFHRRCDNQGPTILIVKIFGSDQIVGGFNPISYQRTRKIWMRNTKEKKENLEKMNSFIFSFQARYYPEETAVISRVLLQHAKEATIKHRLGPCFGIGPDLLVKLDVNDKSTKLHPASYEHSILDRENVEWEDFEIFQVVKAS